MRLFHMWWLLVPALIVPSATAAALAASADARPARPHSAAAGDLVINEIDYDQPGADVAEFIEIKNTTDHTIFLGTFDVLGMNGANNPASQYMRIQLPNVPLGPGEYFVIGDPSVPNVDLTVNGGGFIQNGAPDAIAIVESDPSHPSNDILIDSVSYEGDTLGGPILGGTWTEGSGVGLEDSLTDAFLGISRLPDGIDTNVNNVDLSPRCITPGEPNMSQKVECTDPAGAATPDPGGGSSTPDPSGATATPTEDGGLATETATATLEPPSATPTETPASPIPEVTPTVNPSATATFAPPTPTATTPSATPVPSATATTAVTATEPTPTPTDDGGSLPPVATQTPDGLSATATPPVPLLIVLDSFAAARTGPSTVVIQWRTRSEIDNAGFHLLRTDAAGSRRITGRLIPAMGGELAGAHYTLVDSSAPADKLVYILADVDTRGFATYHGPAYVPPARQYEGATTHARSKAGAQ